jgi:hypothetical protein
VDVQIDLTPTGTLTGDVVDAEQTPIENAAIDVVETDGGTVAAETTTGADGSYVVEVPADVEYEVEATADGATGTSDPVTVTEGATTEADVVLPDDATGVLTGTVTDAGGATLSGATVTVRETASGDVAAEVTTDAAGEYTVDVAAGTEYEVAATADGTTGTSDPVTVTEDTTTEADIVIETDAPGDEVALEVTVSAAPGTVAPGKETELTVEVTNVGTAATAAGIRFETPSEVTIDNEFIADPIAADASRTRTIPVETAADIAEDTYTITATAEATAGDATASADTELTVADETGVARFDREDTGQIEFTDVLSAIAANNTDEQVGGEPVSFTDVLEVIAAHNQETAV